MNTTLRIIYAGDHSSSTIEQVETTCTIQQVKRMVAKMNRMQSSTTIRVVQKGRILANETTIGELLLDTDNQVTLYVTGIPTKTHVRMINESPNLTQQVNYANAGNSKPNEKGEKLKLWITRIILVSFILGFTIFIAWTSLGETLKLPFKGRNNTSLDDKFTIALIIAFVAFFMYVWYRCDFHINANFVYECVKEYILTLLPKWDEAAFKAKYIEHPNNS